MPMPVLSEELLMSVRSVLIRDLRMDPFKTMELRFEEIELENPIFWEWLKNGALSLEGASFHVPQSQIPPGTPAGDDQAFISLRLAQNILLTTVIQVYKAIKAKIQLQDLGLE